MSRKTSEWKAFEQQFPKGAKVQLNAGGPTMVVRNHIQALWEIECDWFSRKKLERGRFAPETLVLAKDDAEPK